MARPLPSLKIRMDSGRRPGAFDRKRHLGKGTGGEASLALKGGKDLAHWKLSRSLTVADK